MTEDFVRGSWSAPRALGLGVVLSALLAVACASVSPAPRTPRALRPHALVIGIDGLRPDQLLRAHTPALNRVMARGFLVADAKNVWGPRNPYNGHSAPNWAAVLTGRDPQDTGISENGDGEHLVDDTGQLHGSVRSLFGWMHVHDPLLETALSNTWPGIGLAPGTILERSGTVVDIHIHPLGDRPAAERDAEQVAALCRALRERDPAFVFVHLSAIDAAGHEFTYEDPRYRAAIERTDALVGELLGAIERRPTRSAERWLVLVTSDHGGPSNATSHADNSDPRTHTVPLLGSADRIQFEIVGKRSIYDVVPTVLEWFEIKPGAGLEGTSLFQPSWP